MNLRIPIFKNQVSVLNLRMPISWCQYSLLRELMIIWKLQASRLYSVANKTHFWSYLVHYAPFLATLDHYGRRWTTLGHSGILFNTLGNIRPLGQFLADFSSSLVHSGLLWCQFGATLGHSELLWCQSGPVWAFLGNFGAFRTMLGHSGPLWPTLSLVGQVWQILANLLSTQVHSGPL